MKNKNIIKIVIIIVIVLAIITAATITAVYFIKKSKFNYEISNVEEYNYSIFYRDEK